MSAANATDSSGAQLQNMDEHIEQILAEQKKLIASNKLLKMWVIGLTVGLVVVAAALGYPEYKRQVAYAQQKAELQQYLQANPMYLTTPSDVKNPTKGATFPVYKYTP